MKNRQSTYTMECRHYFNCLICFQQKIFCAAKNQVKERKNLVKKCFFFREFSKTNEQLHRFFHFGIDSIFFSGYEQINALQHQVLNQLEG
jgi:hypothetical protein